VAPLHKAAAKTIKIEKKLVSSINVDLVPETQQPNLSAVESTVPVRQNIPASYTPVTTYQTATPGMPGYRVPQSNSSAPTASPAYSQTEPAQDPAFSGSSRTGYRRHPRHSYPGESVDSSSGTSQTTSQGSALAEVGTQLLQAWMSKKSENSSSTGS
jgi:hypothetical protein